MVSSEQVQLVKELAELRLHKGEVGIVRCRWQFPTVAYEVEFQSGGQPIRVLLLENSFQPLRKAS